MRSAVGLQVTCRCFQLCQNKYLYHAAVFFLHFIFARVYTYKSDHKQKDQLQPIYYFQFIILFLNDRIRKISNLESLTKLDVLDLHGNKVSLLENNPRT